MFDLSKHGRYPFTPAQRRTIEDCDKLFTKDILARARLWQKPASLF